MLYDHKQVGERIRHRRNELGFTQDELAEKIGRVTKYCADIERGYCGMSIETLLLFCEALKLSPSTLLLGDAVPVCEENDLISQIVAGLSECSEEQQISILNTVRLFTRRM